MTDEELIAAFEKGDRKVAAGLYDRLIGVVDATLYRILGAREHDHDDLVQSAFEQIMLTLARRRFARACSLASWAGAVTTHLALNALRSRMRERRVIDHGPELTDEIRSTRPEDDLERLVGARQELERLRGYLGRMKPEKAQALVLHDVLGHELAEIAVLTGISLAGAQSRLLRAHRELDELVREDASSAEQQAGRRPK